MGPRMCSLRLRGRILFPVVTGVSFSACSLKKASVQGPPQVCPGRASRAVSGAQLEVVGCPSTEERSVRGKGQRRCDGSSKLFSYLSLNLTEIVFCLHSAVPALRGRVLCGAWSSCLHTGLGLSLGHPNSEPPEPPGDNSCVVNIL